MEINKQKALSMLRDVANSIEQTARVDDENALTWDDVSDLYDEAIAAMNHINQQMIRLRVRDRIRTKDGA